MCQMEKKLSSDILLSMEKLLKAEYGISDETPLEYSYEKFEFKNLRRCLRNENITLEDKSIVILGMGNMAEKTAKFCLEENVGEIYIINRTYSKGEKFVNGIGASKDREKIKLISVENYNALPEKRYIMFQCTSLGENDNESLISDLDFYKKVKLGIDFKYQKNSTGFIKYTKKVGRKVISGIKLYVLGIIEIFEEKYGVKVDAEKIEEFYLKIVEESGYEG